MLPKELKMLAMRYMPIIMKDKNEPFPIRNIGITVFDGPKDSLTIPKLKIDPGQYGCKMLIEYAVYFDYDIQHLYDLEHIWIAVRDDGTVKDCLCSFHGMVMHASGIPDLYRTRNGVPVLYMQPGKHAFMPDPKLFGLHVQRDTCCRELAGGGLLIPPMLRDRMSTTPEQDERIRAYIRKHFSFTPSWEFEPAEALKEDLCVTAEELLEKIPGLVEEQLAIIRQDVCDA